ncbi:MAG: GNAT family N-acetyltransferase [Acidimicrobiia bacterium]
MFEPIRTDRLVIRAPASDDLDSLFARRNDPEVARLQDWEFPYPLERATSLIDSVTAMEGPENDEWWMAMVCLPNGTIVGDLVVNLTWKGRSAEVGYALDREQWGHGYATEALIAFVDHLFDHIGVTRVWAMLDPANVASAMLLERSGFLYEGRTRSSYWKDGEVSDDLIYGMVRADRDEWRDRPRGHPRLVELVEVTTENFEDVAVLATHESQKRFVAPMLRSFADALFPEVIDGAPVIPWMRAIVADGESAGFVMLAVSGEHHPDPYLWRLLIDRRHQRRGIATRALQLVIEECLARGDTALYTSWSEGKGSPRPFYLGLGFVETGRIIDEETEARLSLI